MQTNLWYELIHPKKYRTSEMPVNKGFGELNLMTANDILIVRIETTAGCFSFLLTFR